MARFLAVTVTGAVLLGLLPGFHEAHPQDARQSPSNPASRDASPEIRRLLDDLMAADNAGDVDRAVGYYTADALLLPPTDPEIAGREKIRAHYVGAFGHFALPPKPLHDKFLGVVERGADGHWRFARLMWSPVAKPG